MIIQEFTNSIGQIIKPGDKAVLVTCSSGRVRIRKATYLGRTINGQPVLDAEEQRWKYVMKGSGEDIPMDYYREANKLSWSDPKRMSLLKELNSRVESIKIPFTKRVISKLGRIYKIA